MGNAGPRRAWVELIHADELALRMTATPSHRPVVAQTLRFQTLYVFFLISHRRRRLLRFDVTAHPTAARVWRQMIEATPWGQQPSYLIHDRDRVYGADFATPRLAGLRAKSIRTPIQAPRANTIAEPARSGLIRRFASRPQRPPAFPRRQANHMRACLHASMYARRHGTDHRGGQQ